jgi:tetrahydromethanopterin S-methyltransferase subunit F
MEKEELAQVLREQRAEEETEKRKSFQGFMGIIIGAVVVGVLIIFLLTQLVN